VNLRDRAKALRRNATSEERTVWRWLRDRRLCGLKFRRQHAILNYIADFYCAELKLVIEIDGSGHEQVGQDLYDIRRSCDLSTRGVTVIRITNDTVRKRPNDAGDAVIAAIERLRSENQPSPGLRPPSPASGRGH
jgi:very-short-patch-repair endonuclease